MTDTILDLVRALPASEPALRARKDEFNHAVWEAIGAPSPELAPFDYMDDVYRAKAATDALRVRGYSMRLMEVYNGIDHLIRCRFYSPRWKQVEADASTEELSRSAAALLASAGGEDSTADMYKAANETNLQGGN